jgi:hypothetical protein
MYKDTDVSEILLIYFFEKEIFFEKKIIANLFFEKKSAQGDAWRGAVATTVKYTRTMTIENFGSAKKHGQALKGMPGAVLWLLKFPPVAVKSILQHAKAHILKNSVNSAHRLTKS